MTDNQSWEGNGDALPNESPRFTLTSAGTFAWQIAEEHERHVAGGGRLRTICNGLIAAALHGGMLHRRHGFGNLVNPDTSIGCKAYPMTKRIQQAVHTYMMLVICHSRFLIHP